MALPPAVPPALPHDNPTCYHHDRFPCPQCGYHPTYTPQVSSTEAKTFKTVGIVSTICAITIIGLPIYWALYNFYLKPKNGPLEMRAQIKKCPSCGFIWTQPKMRL